MIEGAVAIGFSRVFQTGGSMLLFLRTLALLAVGLTVGDIRVVEQRDPDGKLRLKREMRETAHGEVKHGNEITYFANGNEASRMHYQNDELDGPWKELYSSGKTKAEGAYRHGLKEGLETHYLSDGRKSSRPSSRKANATGSN